MSKQQFITNAIISFIMAFIFSYLVMKVGKYIGSFTDLSNQKDYSYMADIANLSVVFFFVFVIVFLWLLLNFSGTGSDDGDDD